MLVHFRLSKSNIALLLLTGALTFISQSVSYAAVPWSSDVLKVIPDGHDVPTLNLVSNNFHVGRYFSSSRGDDADYLVWVPASFDETKSYNLVIFLGGGKGSMYSMAAELDQSIESLGDTELENYIFVSPDLNAFSLWATVPTSDGPAIILEMQEEMSLKLKLTGKTFLLGHSNGGAGAIFMALTYPQQFNSIAAVSPTLFKWSPFSVTDAQIESYQRSYAPTYSVLDLKSLVEAVRNEFGSDSSWQAFDPNNLIKTEPLSVPLHLYTGRKDPLGFWYLAFEFASRAGHYNKTIPLHEDSNRGHEIGTAFKDIFNQFKSTP